MATAQLAFKHKGRAYVTKSAVQALFGITHMTMYNWRNGNLKGKSKLPSIEVPRGESKVVGFSLPTVEAWAKKNGVEMVGKQLTVIKKALVAAAKS